MALSGSDQAKPHVDNLQGVTYISRSTKKLYVLRPQVKKTGPARFRGGPWVFWCLCLFGACSMAAGILATDISVRATWLSSWSAFSSSASDFDKQLHDRAVAKLLGEIFGCRVAGNFIVLDALCRADQCEVGGGILLLFSLRP